MIVISTSSFSSLSNWLLVKNKVGLISACSSLDIILKSEASWNRNSELLFWGEFTESLLCKTSVFHIVEPLNPHEPLKKKQPRGSVTVATVADKFISVAFSFLFETFLSAPASVLGAAEGSSHPSSSDQGDDR